MQIKRQYIVNEHNHKIAVQIDIDTFEKIEEIIENYGLVRLMQEDDNENEVLDINQAKTYYQTLKKTNEN